MKFAERGWTVKTKTEKASPFVTTKIVPAATMTSALLSPLALGAPGDLDPAFGDLGRLGPILNGPAWSLQSLDDDSILLGGGGLESYYSFYYAASYDTTNFVSLVSDAGAIDPSFAAAAFADTQVFDVARQPDGQIVAVGRKVGANLDDMRLVAFRLQADGQLDTTFASDGLFELSIADHGTKHMGSSVAVDPDGRIVVAGSRDDQVIVLRLLPEGSLDDSFATSGIFAGPETYDFSADSSRARTSILRTADGGYRVTASNPAGCQIVALTADGAIDEAFGTSGIATVAAPSGPSTYCNAMAFQADGRLLVAGHALAQGFATRVLTDGHPDPNFSADAVAAAMADATSVAAADDGSVVVAGTGVSGASIMRLQANGDLDALFGNAGSTFIDLPSDSGTAIVVHDMVVRADGSVVAAGGEHLGNQAFVVKLLGAAGGDSPGVLGITEPTFIHTAEGDAEIVVNVRRTGGAFGSVSVAYETSGDLQTATAGEDYVHATGVLTWADGDTTEQQINVPILPDDSVEHPETFLVTLGEVQGGAGLGTKNATVAIAADGAPFGQINFDSSIFSFDENVVAEVVVRRDYYATGEVSVTLTPVSGTAAAGSDFDATPLTITWADGECCWKFVQIPIVNDNREEFAEAFTVELSNPTGGAVLGPASTARVEIARNDPRPPSSGGGALGYVSLLLLGVMQFMRRARPSVRSRLGMWLRQ